MEYMITVKPGSHRGQTVRKLGGGNICFRLHGDNEVDEKVKKISGRNRTTKIKVESCLQKVEQLEVWIERTGNKTNLWWFLEVAKIEPVKKKSSEDFSSDQPDTKDSKPVFPFHRWISMKPQVIYLSMEPSEAISFNP